MATQVTTPLSVLVLCYLMIVGFVFIMLAMAGVLAYDLNLYFSDQKRTNAIRSCKHFLEREEYGLYQECYYKMVEDLPANPAR